MADDDPVGSARPQLSAAPPVAVTASLYPCPALPASVQHHSIAALRLAHRPGRALRGGVMDAAHSQSESPLSASSSLRAAVPVLSALPAAADGSAARCGASETTGGAAARSRREACSASVSHSKASELASDASVAEAAADMGTDAAAGFPATPSSPLHLEAEATADRRRQQPRTSERSLLHSPACLPSASSGGTTLTRSPIIAFTSTPTSFASSCDWSQ